MKHIARGRLGGFTLIELLVVVLIIGILASIALPQYERAVEKSRVTEAKTMLKSLNTALQAYALATGHTGVGYENSSMLPTLDSLDLSFKNEDGSTATGTSFSTKHWTFSYGGGNACWNGGIVESALVWADSKEKNYRIMFCPHEGFQCSDSVSGVNCKKAGFSQTPSSCVSGYSTCYAE